MSKCITTLCLLACVSMIGWPQPTSAQDAEPSPPAVNKGDQLRFQQTRVVKEMQELEERMLRLAELLKDIEPENASRLTRALKYARDQLIQSRMQQTLGLIQEMELDRAAALEKQLVEQLQKLHDVLLARDEDLDSQIDQLRLLNEIIKQLEMAIDTQKGLLRDSDSAVDKEKQLLAVRQRSEAIQQLIKEQSAHLDKSRELAEAEPSAKKQHGIQQELAKRQRQIHRKTKQLADRPLGMPSGENHLTAAEAAMQQSAQILDQGPPDASLAHQQKAIERLQQEARRLEELEAQYAQDLTPSQFSGFQRAQAENRQLTDGILQSAEQFPDRGEEPKNALQRSSGSMSSAEAQLARQMAWEASQHQGQALEALESAREQLYSELESLQQTVERAVRVQLVEGIIGMRDEQAAVRESTQALLTSSTSNPRVTDSALDRLAIAERHILQQDEELLTLVEEADFGIALAAGLRFVGRSINHVLTELSEKKLSDKLVAAQRQIELDLETLLGTLQYLPARNRQQAVAVAAEQPQNEQRELNRMIAELKLIRLLQQHVNVHTRDLDGGSDPGVPADADLQQALNALVERQEEVRDVTDRLREERGNEIGVLIQ